MIIAAPRAERYSLRSTRSSPRRRPQPSWLFGMGAPRATNMVGLPTEAAGVESVAMEGGPAPTEGSFTPNPPTPLSSAQFA